MSTAFLGLIEACPDAIVVSDLASGRVRAANAAASALFGLPLEHLVGADRHTLVDIHDPRLLEATIAREQTGRYRGGFRIVRADGRPVEVGITTVSFVSVDGAPLIGSVMRDLGQDAPAAGGDDVFISAFDMMLELGPGGVITDVNDAASARLGYTRDELLGRVSTDFVAPESHAMVIERLGRRLRGDEPSRATVHFDVITKDGERFPVSSTAVTIFDDGQPVGSRVVLRDIVERRRLEDVERSYRELFASAFEILVSISPDGTIEDVNEAGARLAGVDREELLGRNLTEFLDPAEIAVLRGRLESRSSGGDAAAALEMTLVSQAGVRIPVHVTATAVVDGARLVRYVAVATDLRPARAREEERRQLDAEINQAEKLRSLGILAGGIAHDFNNILTAILGHVSLAQREGVGDEEVAESLAVIELGARRAAELANQMLAYAGQGRYVVEPIAIGSLAAGGVERLRGTIRDTVAIELAVSPEPTCVDGDASQLLQVLFALVNNAAEACGDATGKVTVEVGHASVGRDQQPPRLADGRRLGEGEYVTLRVADTGGGMTDDIAARIFEPFYTTKTAGRGLGLAAVLGVVRGHGGGLTFETTIGTGSEFCVFLPAGAAAIAPPAATPTGNPDGRRVLVVDDEPAVRAVVSRMLSRASYVVREAEDGQSGIAELSANRGTIDLVLLDLNMPGLSPEETVKGIRALAPEVPLLLMSGYTEHAAEALGQIQPSDFIQKPFSVDELLARAAALLAR
jgi:two-component system cell cycle sensor histidine kinase/response regulator CckA